MNKIVDRVNMMVETIQSNNWKINVNIREMAKMVIGKWHNKNIEDEVVVLGQNTGYVYIEEKATVVFFYIALEKDCGKEMMQFNYYIYKEASRFYFDILEGERGKKNTKLSKEIYVVNNHVGESTDIFRNHYGLNSDFEDIYEIEGMTGMDIIRSKVEKHKKYLKFLNYKNKVPREASNKREIIECERLRCMLDLNVENSEVADFYKNVLEGNTIGDIQKAIERINYVCSLPYKLQKPSNICIEEMRQLLDRKIYGMSNAKDAVIRYFAARKYGAGKNRILCLTGKPGAGKSLLAETVSEILGGVTTKIDCSNVHRADEFFKGHSYTYSGSAPGEIIMSIEKSGAKNCCIVLEEIDKGSNENVRELQASLITILDPQNSRNFRDRYLQSAFDISDVTFIVTCNDVTKINPILLDRLEVVEVEDYSRDEKIEIARKYIIPEILAALNIQAENAVIDDLVYSYIIKEAKISSLRKIKEILTKVVTNVFIENVKKEPENITLQIETKDVSNIVRVRKSNYEEESEFLGKLIPGVATMLSVSSDGEGIVTHISAVVIKDGQGNVSLGGNLSDTFRESAETAVAYVKSSYYEENKRIREFVENKYSIHIQAKGFDVRKEGASGGVSTALAVYSAITEIPINRKKWATTGELDLSGRILPVGGIKEKVETAREMGIENIIVPFVGVCSSYKDKGIYAMKEVRNLIELLK